MHKYFNYTPLETCYDCKYISESIVSDGYGTHKYYCSRIRGEEREEDGTFVEDEMSISKYRKICEFFK